MSYLSQRQVRRHYQNIFSIFFNMKVYCVLSLESPHRGDSNDTTKYTIFNIKKEITINYPKSATIGFISQGLKNEFETAVVNEPSVFQPLKFYCINEYHFQLMKLFIFNRHLCFLPDPNYPTVPFMCM